MNRMTEQPTTECEQPMTKVRLYVQSTDPTDPTDPTDLPTVSATETELFQEKITWATTEYPGGQTCKMVRTETHTVGQLKSHAMQRERAWGNRMIGNTSNGNWTTLLGERLVFDVLKKLGKNPRIPRTISRYSPDIETDDFVYEVKTRTWCVTGTAGEKVLGVPFKYSDVPHLYGKPLRIVCVGFQEYELTHGNTRVFGTDLSPNKRVMLELYKKMDIEFVKFSDLTAQL